MDMSAAVTAIRARLVAEWAARTEPLRWENENNVIPDTPAAFVFVEIIGEGQVLSEHVAKGLNHYRADGVILAHAFVPKGEGAGAGFRLAEAVADVYRGKRLAGITYGAASIRGAEMDADRGNYWHCPVEIDFTFDSHL